MAIVVGGSSWNWFEQSSDSRPTRGRKTSNGGKSGSFLEVSRRGGNYFGRAPISIPPFLPFFFSIRCVVVFVRFCLAPSQKRTAVDGHRIADIGQRPFLPVASAKQKEQNCRSVCIFCCFFACVSFLTLCFLMTSALFAV